MAQVGTKPPAYHYLHGVVQSLAHADKCEHNAGQWLVEWEGKLYSIQPPNNLQMWVWRDEARKKVGDKADKAIRWLCHTCGTVQQP